MSDFSNIHSTQPEPPRMHFSDDQVCGEGASCRVYQMRIDGVRVAVKRLKDEYLTHPTYRAAYRKEFAIGRQLKHDGLPIYRELKEGVDEVYIVMDFVDGISLEDFIATSEGKKYFNVEDNVHRFFLELLSVLGYLHRSGVVHCDLKPENIMLRHTDRGVMLLDLDKCYSDTLDLTHGGTAKISEPLGVGEHPTVHKDLSAIGYIIDWLNANIDGFPNKSLKRFREACNSKDATAETLQRSLNDDTRRSVWPWLTALLAIAAISVILALNLGTHHNNYEATPEPKTDTIVTIIQSQPEMSSAINTPELRIDFDGKMTSVIRDINAANEKLKASNLTDTEITSLIYSITETYTSGYRHCISEYKRTYPNVPGGDVELAVAKSSEASRVSRLFQEFTQAAADTIATRNLE